MSDNIKSRKKRQKSDGSVANDAYIVWTLSIGKSTHFPGSRAEKKSTIYEDFMRTGLTKKQKVTEVYYNAKDPTAEVYTHDTKLKKRLLEYAAKFPELCQQTDDDEHGGLRFESDKSRISIRLTAPYSKERITKLRTTAKSENLI